MLEGSAQLIARLTWGETPPTPEEAAAARISHWLLPARLTPCGELELAIHPDRLPPGQFSLEWCIETSLTPASERRAAALFKPWLEHARALRINDRALLWIRDPELLCHPQFTRQRLAPALLLAAAPPECRGFEGSYERSERIPCLELENGCLHYESYLFHAHHRPVGEAELVVPSVCAEPATRMEFFTATNYREWLALSSAWSELRHSQPEQRLVLVEHWQGHHRWFEPPDPPILSSQLTDTPIPPCEERGWGVMDAHRPALLVHGFYLDILEAMLQPLVGQAPPLALYVSTPLSQFEAVSELLLLQGWDQVCLIGVPNRGRDMAPFLLELLPRALQAKHPWLVKLHTKRSAQTPGGEAWGQRLLEQLGTPAVLRQLGFHFADPDAPALLYPCEALLPTTVCLSGNVRSVSRLLYVLGMPPKWWLGQNFVAGSMWAARCSVLTPLTRLVAGWKDFEPEAGQFNATLAHALERMVPTVLGLACVSTFTSSHGSQAWDLPYGHPWANPEQF